MKIKSLTAILSIITATSAMCSAENILDNGKILPSKSGEPEGFSWGGFAGSPAKTPNRFSVVVDEEIPFARIVVPPDTGKQVATLETKDPVPVPSGWTSMNVSAKIPRIRLCSGTAVME